MPDTTTTDPSVPVPIMAGLADVTEQVLAVLEILTRIDIDRADRLCTAVDVLTADLPEGETFDWAFESGLHDFLDVMSAIRKVADATLTRAAPRFKPGLIGDGPCTREQVAELAAMVWENIAARRARLDDVIGR